MILVLISQDLDKHIVRYHESIIDNDYFKYADIRKSEIKGNFDYDPQFFVILFLTWNFKFYHDYNIDDYILKDLFESKRGFLSWLSQVSGFYQFVNCLNNTICLAGICHDSGPKRQAWTSHSSWCGFLVYNLRPSLSWYV